MTESRKAKLSAEVDASGAKKGFEEIKSGARDMAQAVGQTAQQAGKAVSGIGDGAQGSAQKVERATKDLIGSIQRTTAAMEAGERGTRKYYEALANQRGVSIDALKPYLTQLDEVSRKQAAANQALNTGSAALNAYGMSARATTAALRQLPAQVTDIVTGLASGQAPLTVLIQQGGQLKDVFGGIGPAARALGGYIVGLVNPLTIGAAVLGTLAVAAHQGAQELRAFQAAVAINGNAVGLSISNFTNLRDSLAGIAGTKGKAAEALTSIAANAQITGRNVQAVAEAAILMEKATGQAVSKTVDQFAKLAEEPAKAAAELNRQYNFLTASTFAQIKALEEQGKKAEAADVAERALAEALKTRAAGVVENVGSMERAWRTLAGAAKAGWDAMLNVGREKSLAEQFADVSAQVSKGQRPFDVSAFGGNAEARAQLQANRAAMQDLFRRMELEQRNATATTETTAANRAAVSAIDEVTKANDRYASKQEQLNKALRDYRQQLDDIRKADPASKLLDPKLIARTEAGIRDQFKDRAGASAAKAAERELEKQKKLVGELSGLTSDFYEKWDNLAAQAKGGKITTQQLEDLQRKLLSQQPFFKEYIKGVKDAATETQKFLDDQASDLAAFERRRTDERDRVLASLRDQKLALEDSAQLQQLELSMVGATSQQRETAVEQLRIELQLKRDIERINQNLLLTEEGRAQAIAEATDNASRAKVQAANRAVLNEWQRTADSINNSLTDALLRGFESGKGFAENFRDTLKNMFATLVLRPIIQAVMAPVSGQLASFGQGIGNAITGGGNSFGSLGNLGTGVNSMFPQAGNFLLNSFGSNFASGFSGVGGSFASSVGGGLATDALGATVAEGSAAASLGSTGSAIGGAFSSAIPFIGAGIMAAQGNYGGAAGAAIGTMIMPGIGTVIGAILGSMIKPGGETRLGAEYTNTAKLRGPSGGEINGDATRAAIQATIDNINGNLKTLGSDLTVGNLFSGLESSKNGKGFAYAGVQLSNGVTAGQGGLTFDDLQRARTNRRGSMTPEEAVKAFGEELKQTTLQALQAADVPGKLGEYLRSLGDIDKLTGGSLDAALNRVQKVLTERQTLEEKLFDLTHTSVEQATRAREKERAAIDESNHALYDHVARLSDLNATLNAQRDQLTQAYQNESSELQGVVSRHAQYAKDLRAVRDSLVQSGGTMSRTERTQRAQNVFTGTLSSAVAGNEDALQSLGGAGRDYIEAVRGSARTSAEVAAAIARVTAGLTTAAASSEGRATVAQQQLDSMKQQLTALGLLNTTVVSVGQALSAYLATQTAIQQANLDYTAAIAAQASAPRSSTPTAAGPAPAPTARTIFDDWTITENGWTWKGQGPQPGIDPFHIGAFATGGLASGAALVGERGMEAVDFNTPGRVYTNEQTRGMFASNAALVPLLTKVVASIDALRAEGRTADVATVASLQKIEAKFRKWDAVGMPLGEDMTAV